VVRAALAMMRGLRATGAQASVEILQSQAAAGARKPPIQIKSNQIKSTRIEAGRSLEHDDDEPCARS
jgi:hypothetical protein